MKKTRVLSLKQDFTRLTLGMFASSFSSYPLTWTYVGQAEAPVAPRMSSKRRAMATSPFASSSTTRPICRLW